jgi:hypothetical protein
MADCIKEVAPAVPCDAGHGATNTEHVGLDSLWWARPLHRAHAGQPSICSVANDSVLLVHLNNKTRG